MALLRRSVVALCTLVLLALLPLSASAAGDGAQTFTGTIDITPFVGTCPTAKAVSAETDTAQATSVVNDAGTFDFFLDSTGPFPNQVAGEFAFNQAHSEAHLEYTGTLPCTVTGYVELSGEHFWISVDFVAHIACDGGLCEAITSVVWSGRMVDDSTGKQYRISGSGRGNPISDDDNTGVFTLTCSGTATPGVFTVTR